MKKFSLVALGALFLGMTPLFSQTTYYSIADGNWDTPSTWSAVGFGGIAAETFPVAGDVVNIGGGYTVAITSVAANCASLNIVGGTLNVGNGINVTTTTTIGTGGVLNVTSTAGTKAFNGLVTISVGGVWNETANESIDFRGGITKLGTFTAATGNHNFRATQTLTGNFTIPRFIVSGSGIEVTNSGTITSSTQLTVTGANAVLTNSGTISAQAVTISTVSASIDNDGSFTINGTLTGSGTTGFPVINQGASAALSLNGTTPTNFTINGGGTINTVTYGGTDQTILSGSYNSLNLAGTGLKTFRPTTIAITGNVTLAGTATTSGTGTTLNFNGTTSQNISGGGSLLVDNVQLSGSGTKTFDLNTTIALSASVGSGTNMGLNSFTYSANTIAIAGGSQGAGTYGSLASTATFKTNAFFSGTGLITVASGSLTYYAIVSGNWTSPAIWSTLGFGFTENFGSFPLAGETVNIGNGLAINITGSQACGSLSFSTSNTSATTLDVSGGSLTASGTITIPRPTSGSGSNILAVGGGALTAAALSFTGTSGGVQRLSIIGGSVVITGNVTSANTSGTIQFTGAGSMDVGGSMFTAGTGTLTTFAGSTFRYTGSGAQTVQAHTYRNLTLSGGGAKSSATGATNLGISTGDKGNLIIDDGTDFSIGNATYNVWGNTIIGNGLSGSLNFTSTSGSKTFGDLVTVKSGATWDNSIHESVSFTGGITNQGTFIAGTGTYTFSTFSQSIIGVSSIPALTLSTPGSFLVLTINGNLTSDVITITGANNSITNNGTLTATTSLTGTGFLTQNAGATLNLNGTVNLSRVTDAIIATSSGNTVNYAGANQTVAAGNYFNLSLGGSGIKTLLPGTTSIGGDLTASGTVSFTSVAGLAIGGNVSLGSNTTFVPSSYTHTVAGNWASNGTLNGAGSTITFNGPSRTIFNSATTLFYNVVMAGTGTKTLTSAIVTDGNLTINSGAVVDLGTFSSAAGTLTIFGASQPTGQHGSTPAAPAYINDLAFAPNTGILNVGGLVYYLRQSGNWNVASTWSLVNYGGSAASTTPGPNDEVRIGSTGLINPAPALVVNVTASATCKTLTFSNSGLQNNNLNINSNFTLTVTSNITIPRATNPTNNIFHYLNVNAGTLNAGNILFTNGHTSTASNSHRIQVTTGVVNVSGNITATGVSGLISISGAGLLRVYGSIPLTATGATGMTLTLSSTSTVEYAGADQAVRDANHTGNMIISGTGTKTWSATSRTVGANLTINSGTALSISGTVGITGNTIVSGNLTLNNNQTRTFTGNVTLNTGSTWSVPGNGPCTFNGDFTNNATTLTYGTGIYTFAGASKILSGSALTPIPNVAITGTYTNNGNFTVGTSLSGIGGALTNGATGTLNIGGSVSITTLIASTVGNTVNYTGTGAQTVYSPAGGQYNNLSFNNTTATGIATMPATINVSGNLTNNGAVAVGGFVGFNPNGGTVIFNGSNGGQSIQGTAPSIFNNLTSANALSGVTLMTAVTVNNLLSIQAGDFDNYANLLTMGDGATLERNVVAALIGNAPITGTPPAGNSYNVIYSGIGDATTGPELEGSHVKDVTINLDGTLTQINPLNLYGIMLVNTGATYDPGDNLLTVKSFSDVGLDAGGSIGRIQGTFLDNPVKVERYFRSLDNRDHFISSPVDTATIRQLQAAFPITGNFTGSSFPCTGCNSNNSNLRWYKESVTGIINRGYQNFPSPGGNRSSALTPGVGYDVYMWNGGLPETIVYNGLINQGPIPNLGKDLSTGQNVTKTIVGAGTPTADGWNLIGNPYPAPITWTGIDGVSPGWTLNNVKSVAWQWDVNNSTWVSTLVNPEIAIGQAFWVEVNTVGIGVIDITEEAKSTARSGAYYRERTEDVSMLKIKLSNGDVTESAFILLNQAATAQYAFELDIPKIELGIESMHMTLVKDGKHLGFYGYNESMENDIPLRIVAETEGKYELSFESLGAFQGLSEYYLFDVVTQERVLFRPDLKFTFNYSKKHPEHRFILTKNDVGNLKGIAVSAYPNPTTGKFQIVVNSGESILAIELISADGHVVSSHSGTFSLSDKVELNLEDQPNGVYLIKVRLASGITVKRIIKH